MIYGCIGKDLTYSLSTEIHRLCGNESYELKNIQSQELVSFLEAKDFCGINVTMPFKKAVLPFMSSLGEDAIRTGVINTIRNDNGTLIGDNTDYGGLLYLLRKNQMEISGKNIMILGDGGTSHTAFALAITEGANNVLVVSRHPGEGMISYEQALIAAPSVDGIINTTSCGMTPNEEDCPISLESFSRLSWVADVIYRPLRSRLVVEAQNRGIAAAGGLRMLVAQAVKTEELFGLCPYSEERIEEIYTNIVDRYENLVFIGMPGAGKTKIGMEKAILTGRAFFDTDQLIFEREHMTPKEIILSKGERTFRDIESQIVAHVSRENGCVISTGGGVVEREENIRRMKQNGTIIYLSRSLDELTSDKEHPLSDNHEKLEALYKKRKPLYEKAADITMTI